jgi:hypothetical protein
MIPAARPAMNPNPKPSRPDQMPLHQEESLHPTPGSWVLVGIAWVLVGLPLAWGIYKTFEKAAVLFRH